MELVLLFQPFLLVFTIFLSLCFLFYVLRTKPTSQKLQLPPGGSGWPFIGETLEFLSLAKKNCIEKFISDRQNKYSSYNLFKTSYIGENFVFLCSTEANKFFFSNDTKLFKTWFPKNFDKIFLHIHKLDVTNEIAKIRKQTSTLFGQHDALQNNVTYIDAVAKEHLKVHWNREEVKVHPLAKKFTLAISLRSILNIQDSETVKELENLFNCLMTGMFSLPINIPGTKFNRAVKASREIRKKFEGIIRQRKIEVSEKSEKSFDSSKDLLSMLLMDGDKNEEGAVESDVASNLCGYIVAAYDNTSTAIVTIVKYLAELPEVYEQVYQEQIVIANSKGPGELLNLEDINKMKYSWNVASEVLRLQPPFSGLFREVLTDFNYDGFLIPKGWKVHLTVHATHKSSKYFQDPEKFDPSRFQENKLVPFSYIPFGRGPHMCPGKEHAKLQILVLMHNLVKTFRWEKLIPDEPLIRDPILAPAKGLPVRLYRHKP
ncbi:hypothetical protein Patl1_08075 [Pistacia atlantica]|uniref:Uncharacterized protein n=1 Tax=Pistacia atlantica TaxID=434234 RepID=A0ACC1AFW1_9ROSI|nr:hypothetical protein Patl1_08075 [Pistacia atlantica]